MKKTYYVIENEFGEIESKEVNTLSDARKELKALLKYYKENMSDGKPPYELLISKHTEIDNGDYIEEEIAIVK